MVTDCSLTEEEKKALTSMLGKLYVSPTSTPEKLQTVHDRLTDAIDARIAGDAPSRNALSKLHAALTKAIGAVVGASGGRTVAEDGGESTGRTSVSSSRRLAVDEITGNDEQGKDGKGGEKDSVLEELLEDGEPEL